MTFAESASVLFGVEQSCTAKEWGQAHLAKPRWRDPALPALKPMFKMEKRQRNMKKVALSYGELVLYEQRDGEYLAMRIMDAAKGTYSHTSSTDFLINGRVAHGAARKALKANGLLEDFDVAKVLVSVCLCSQKNPHSINNSFLVFFPSSYTLHYTALHYTTLHYTALHYTYTYTYTLHHTTLHYTYTYTYTYT